VNDTRPLRLPGAAAAPLDLPSTELPPSLDAAGATDRGRRRDKNEDCYAVMPLFGGDGMLLVVADGLGGASFGEVASRIAVDTLVEELTRRALPADRTPRLALRRAVEKANQALGEALRHRPELKGFGTTLTAVLVVGRDAWIAHVGDSRAYLWRGGRLEHLTRDHTMAERLREQGLVENGQKVPSWESVLWNALGPSADQPQLEERQERLEPGDRLLLCSDGLTRHVADDEMARRLAQRTPAQELCDGLVAAANEAGGEDNITVVVARAVTGH
jgi:protein phosphatase